MRPSDFPVRLPAPTAEQLQGCDSVRLQLPVLQSCGTPPPHWDLQWSHGGADDWHVLQPRTAGGRVVAVGLDSYSTGS